VVQGALKLILEAIFEADFCPNSYAFRPKRSPHQALAQVRRSVMRRMSTVVDADLSNFFGASGRSLMLSAGAIPASVRGMSRPTENRALDSWR
jgi:RNA-directed DNA polymerase